MKPRIAISLGDPRGVGPEVVAAALAAPGITDQLEPLVFGDPALLQPPHVARCTEAEAAHAAGEALHRAVDAVIDGRADALCTAPLHKTALLDIDGGPFMGQTGYLGYRFQGTPLMTFVAGRLRIALLSVHIPIGEVPRLLAEFGVTGIVRRIAIFDRGLRDDLGVERPRIALLGLNPHAGEDGLIGNDEERLLRPAVDEARRAGFDVSGPWPADGYFANAGRGALEHDGALACYHDQGLVGFKALAPREGVQLTLGLRAIRTSCQHGTARDRAGQGIADPSSMLEALRLAAEIAQRRSAARR
ncbi:MAG: 4-hydroxythreonine-4-phosphate dehydrogenase PdxA [Deltaproteobacteria bacterium]|nr:4-hydroxythreonine-4-phosphate dehydrogenase PdxA [Deltaproteobacteria bacterium]